MTTQQIISKINKKNKEFNKKVNISKISLDDCKGWFYDDEQGEIRNEAGTFFSITGLCSKDGEKTEEQPVIIQNEIGYLGIIRKPVNGEMNYLMQYKIEPGNINKIQISPTIQATKSNFTRAHGGKAPAYLDYFVNASRYKIVVDQIQSEQSSRFLGKRNRNIIIELDENDDIDVLDSHDWMTLPQIKELMRENNLVNMDTRTVLSCLPFSVENYSEEELCTIEKSFKDKALFNSIFHGCGKNLIPEIYQYINNYKMFSTEEINTVKLSSLKNWGFDRERKEFACNFPYSFKVVFCDIEIEGREVKHWCQPLVEASGIALFGLFTTVVNNTRMFLVKCKSETGCFDKIELAPTVQREFVSSQEKNNVDILFDEKLKKNENILFDTLLSEEGGRFYHEQNRNVIIETEKDSIDLPEGYFWCDYKTLNTLCQVNNTLNIQLRNLLSVLEF